MPMLGLGTVCNCLAGNICLKRSCRCMLLPETCRGTSKTTVCTCQEYMRVFHDLQAFVEGAEHVGTFEAWSMPAI